MRHNAKSLIKALFQIAASDDPAGQAEALAREIKGEAKNELGEYAPSAADKPIIVEGVVTDHIEVEGDGSRTS
jgi:hypothetical protein